MDYSPDELQAAYLADETLRLSALAEDVSRGVPQRPASPDVSLATVPPEPWAVASLTHDEIDAAVAELAAMRGEDIEDTTAQVLALSGGERSVDALALAVADLAELNGGPVHLAADLTVAERRELARQGLALPDGSYPVPDLAYLHAAAVLAASGHGDVAEARKLIRKRARELGVEVTRLPGFTHADVDAADDGTAGSQHKILQAAGYSDADIVRLAARQVGTVAQDQADPDARVAAIVSRNAGRGMFDGPERVPGYAYAEGVTPGKEVNASDPRQPHRGGQRYPGVGRRPGQRGPGRPGGDADSVMSRHPEFFSTEDPHGANVRHSA